MKLSLLLLCALTVAGSAAAQGAYNIAKQQARNAANGGAQPGANPPAASAPAYAPPDPALQATLRSIGNLRADLDQLDSNPTNTVPLRKDLTAAAQATKPSLATATSLSQSLAAAVAGNAKLHAQHQKLAQYIHAACNGAHLTAAQLPMVLDAVKKTLTDGGVPAGDIDRVISDLKTIATETK